MSIRTLLIADLHLNSGTTDKTNLFLNFCQTHAVKADQLFILGDFFNTWLGDDLSLDDYQTLISALKILSKTTKIFVMTGNRDFLLGQVFEQRSGCTLISTPYLLSTPSAHYVLTHGDELCTDDQSYQRMKSILQHPITIAIFLRLPKKLRLRLAGQLRKKSLQAQQYKSRDIMDVNPNAVSKLMQKYPNADLIHGHTHRLNTHVERKFTRHVLGDWSNHQGNAIEIETALNRLKIN